MKRIFVSCLLFLAVPLTIFGLSGHELGVLASEDETGATALVRELGSIDPRARESAHAKLAAMGEAAREALVAGRESSDSEVKWRCERLLSKLGPGTVSPDRDDPDGDDSVGDEGAGARAVRDPFDGLVFSDRESLIDRLTAPEDREPSGFRGLFGGLPGPRGLSGLSLFFDDFDARHREMMEEMEALRRRALEGFGNPGSTGITSSSRWSMAIRDGDESIEFEADDEGARATVTREEADGTESIDTFEAESLDQFRETFPDLSKRLGLDDVQANGPWGGFRIGPGLGMARPSKGLDTRGFDPEELDANRLPKKRLGILCGEVPRVLSRHLELPERVGIVVEEVESGSAAERLGLAPYDILMGFQGVPVRKPDDIRSTLLTVREGDVVTLDIVRRGETHSLSGAIEF